MTLDSRTRWLALLIVCLGDLMIVLDVTIVGVALAVDPRGPRVLGDVVGMGRECVSAHLRRVPAARRTARRPLRAPAPLHRRDRALHGRFARVRARRLAGCVDRRTGRAGSRRRGRLGCRSLADRDALHRARRAREGDGRLRVRRGRRRLDRRACSAGSSRTRSPGTGSSSSTSRSASRSSRSRSWCFPAEAAWARECGSTSPVRSR